MSRRAAAITQSALKSVVKAVISAGFTKEQIVRITISPDGSVNVLFGDRSAEDRATLNEWDEVLK